MISPSWDGPLCTQLVELLFFKREISDSALRLMCIKAPLQLRIFEVFVRCALIKKYYTYKTYDVCRPSISPMLTPVGVHWPSLDSLPPLGSVCGLRHPVECADVFLAPILDVVHPFPTWYFLLILSIHDSEHCIFQESVIVIHPTEYVNRGLKPTLYD